MTTAKLSSQLIGTPDGKVHHIETKVRLGETRIDEHGQRYVVAHVTTETETIDYFEEHQ